MSDQFAPQRVELDMSWKSGMKSNQSVHPIRIGFLTLKWICGTFVARILGVPELVLTYESGESCIDVLVYSLFAASFGYIE